MASAASQHQPALPGVEFMSSAGSPCPPVRRSSGLVGAAPGPTRPAPCPPAMTGRGLGCSLSGYTRAPAGYGLPRHSKGSYVSSHPYLFVFFSSTLSSIYVSQTAIQVVLDEVIRCVGLYLSSPRLHSSFFCLVRHFFSSLPRYLSLRFWDSRRLYQ